MKKILTISAALCIAITPLAAYDNDPFYGPADSTGSAASASGSLTAEYDKKYSDRPIIQETSVQENEEKTNPAEITADSEEKTVPEETPAPEENASIQRNLTKTYSSYEEPDNNERDAYRNEYAGDYDFGYMEEENKKKTSPRTGIFLSTSSFQTSRDLQEFIKTTQLDHINGMLTFGGDIFYSGIAGGVEVIDETLTNVITNTWCAGPVVGFSIPLTEHLRPFAQAGLDVFFDGFFALKAGAGFDYMLTKHIGVTFDWNYNWKYDTSVIFYKDGEGNLVFNTNVDTRKYFENPFTQYHAFSTGISITW